MPIIVYIDMNSFFVSCHQAKNPELKNKNVIVASDSRRAVVISASYQARKYNIKTGMPLYQAKELCPNAIYIKPNRNLYMSYSHKIFSYLKNNFTNLIVRTSIDEYCLDITAIYHNYGSPEQCATAIQQQLLTTFDLPCSIGISFTIQLAKIASKLKKPQGIMAIMPEDITKILYPLPIENLNGIGPKTAAQLKTLNIYLVRDLVDTKQQAQLSNIFGKRYWAWVAQINGKTTDNIDVNHRPQVKSIGRDYTLEYDSNNYEYLSEIFKTLIKEVIKSAHKKGLTGKTVLCGFKIERNRWVTKQITLQQPVDENMMHQTVLTLFKQIWKYPQMIRAVRVAVKTFN